MKFPRIIIEGTDGAGKSTVIKHLESMLTAQGHDVEVIREPGSTPLAEFLRDSLVNNPELIDNPESELLMFLAARASTRLHIRALRAQGKTVICDRAYHSTFAYQVCDDRTRALFDSTLPLLGRDEKAYEVLLTCEYETAKERRGQRDEETELDKRMNDFEKFESVKHRYLKFDSWNQVIETDYLGPLTVAMKIVEGLHQHAESTTEQA